MIQVQNLTRYYGRIPAIQNVSFEVEKGEILGFLGPNAAGKTTTMRILTCYMPATSGTARVAGYDVFSQSMDVRKRIGYLPEQPPVYMDMTVKSYLNFVAKIKGVDSRERKNRINEVMAKTAISEVQDSVIRKLSKGYKQRVGLAQALVHNPDVLVLDEPTIGLDPNQIKEVRGLIKSLAGNHTIILSTHILPEVEVTCDRAVIIHRGRVVAQDTIANMTQRRRGAERLIVQVEGPNKQVRDKLASVSGVKKVTFDETTNGVNRYEIECAPDRDLRRELAQAVVQNGWGLLELRAKDMTLEEVFLALTTEEGGARA
ncbi:MAG: ATP-binding cassette domain-containing protein [candidate division KSB1 bacterium]|nr:ATP-binding cassette domain-containing protein [candidate division KSB1 bacterium]MDZ7303488.1 ATP-binding cassette domain-containing protein [candidate division KSB1 bacterium]MDZ7312710.1 ATP-binding cassette domain-containing protein [candidate division KSB1 bacterium]